jgi:hypothetical protein
MIRKRILAVLATAGTALSFVAGVTMPVSHADVLPNGYDVSCKQQTPTTVLCAIAGCPRIDNDDDAGDVVHTRISGGAQLEFKHPCGSTSTDVFNISNYPSGFDYQVQGCRKHGVGKDVCGVWSLYRYTPPAAPPPPPPPPVKCPNGTTVPAGQQCPAAPPPPVKCPDGTTVPAGQQCPAPKPVTDAISLSFGPPSFGNITATVSNSSDLNGKCTYDATGLAKTHQNFNVPAHGSTPLTFSGINTGTSYHAVVSCLDASGKQTQPIGSDSKDVRF